MTTTDRTPALGAIAREALAREARHIASAQRFSPGMIVTTRVRAFHLGVDGGKARPGVLICRYDSDQGGAQWKIMGFTTLPAYKDGNPRVPIPDWEGCGINGPGFLWGPRLPIVPEHDIEKVIGQVSADCAEAIISLCDHLTTAEVDGLLAGVNPETV